MKDLNLELTPNPHPDPMEPVEPNGPGLFEQTTGILADFSGFAESLSQTWRLYQVGIIVALALAAYVAHLFLKPRIDAWMHTRSGWPKWRLRLIVIFRKRIMLFYFVVFAWATVVIMRQVTWPSRSYLIALAATIVTAWFVVALMSRFVKNGFLRRVVTWSLWIYVTLFYLGKIDTASEFLGELAVDFGDFHLSALAVIKALVVTAVLLSLARFGSQTTRATIQKNDDFSPSMRVLVFKFVQVSLYGFAFFIGLKAVGFDLTGLAFLSGAVGLGLGFGLQKVVSNLVSGIIILLDKSIKPGDVISLGETFGWINTLGARYVSVVTRDGREYLIPNEDLITGQVVNWSHSNDFVRLDIFFGTAYGDDPHRVREFAIEAAKSVDRILTHRPPVCHIVGFGDSSVDYILRFWITDPTGGLTNIRGQVYLALWDVFKKNNISIPFPQREVKVLPGENPKMPGM